MYNSTLWAYAIRHNEPAAAREFLQYADGFVNQCGAYLVSPLLTIDPVARQAYQHLDYRPLVNARAHRLGQRRQIVNDRFHGQYHQLLKILGYRRDLDDPELMAVTYYLLLQDRVDEALETFARVRRAAGLAPATRLLHRLSGLLPRAAAHALAVQVVENYGQLHVMHSETGRPLRRSTSRSTPRCRTARASSTRTATPTCAAALTTRR